MKEAEEWYGRERGKNQMQYLHLAQTQDDEGYSAQFEQGNMHGVLFYNLLQSRSWHGGSKKKAPPAELMHAVAKTTQYDRRKQSQQGVGDALNRITIV